MTPVLVSELSRRSNVPVATIKYYLREGLLPAGEATSVTRASYDETHVSRLRLVRALVEIAGMPLQRVKEVVGSLDDEGASLHDAVGRAHSALSPEPAEEPSEASRARVAGLAEERDWQVNLDGPHARALAAALDQLDTAGHGFAEESLGVYAEAAARLATVDLSGMPSGNRPGAAAYAVIGTLLTEPVLVSLRRMAHEDLSRRRYG